LDTDAEARRQVILADRLVLSKTDLVDGTAIERLTARLRPLNPRAEILTADCGAIDPAVFVAPARRTRSPPSGFAADAVHSDGIRSFVWVHDQPLAWEAFARAIETLIALRGADLLRVKGLLNVRGSRGPVVVQVVGHLAHPPAELIEWADEDHRSRLVFIT